MNLIGQLNEEEMMRAAKQPDNPADFDEVYMMYYPALNRYACTMVKDDAVAEDMVHNVFLKLVENGDALSYSIHLKAYLYRAVYNECMNHIKHEHIVTGYQNQKIAANDQSQQADRTSIQHKELKQAVTTALNLLPEQCRKVFQLSRYEELTYKEIAAVMNISVNTVEKHMVKALKRLRIQLEEYLPLLIFWLLN